jgi:hypothetical protein
MYTNTDLVQIWKQYAEANLDNVTNLVYDILGEDYSPRHLYDINITNIDITVDVIESLKHYCFYLCICGHIQFILDYQEEPIEYKIEYSIDMSNEMNVKQLDLEICVNLKWTTYKPDDIEYNEFTKKIIELTDSWTQLTKSAI